MHYELFIALRHIKSRRRQSLISISSIGIAVMILIISNAFMAGFTYQLYASTIDNLPHVVVSPDEGKEHIQLYRTYIQDIGQINGIEAISPALVGEASFNHKDNIENGVLRGVHAVDENAVSRISRHVTEGDFHKLDYSRNSLAIGDDLAEKLEVTMGEVIELSFPDASTMQFKIIAIYDTGTSADETFAYTSLKSAQDFYADGDVINNINIRIEDFDDDIYIATQVQNTGYQASGWTQTNPEIMETIYIESTSNNIILGLILLIASFGVVSTLNMLVMEKTKEIGILMAMGTTISAIRKIFILESGILGLMGALCGAAAGIVISLSIGSYPLPPDVYGIDTIPVILNPLDILLTISIVFLLNLIAGTYPAQRAAKLDPVRSISSN